MQCLAAPFYLHWLAQHEYLEKPQFVEFLRYLRYWHSPAYARYIEYPDCLVSASRHYRKLRPQRFLDRLIDDEAFRRNLKFVEFRDLVDREQYEGWRQNYHTTNVFTSLLPKPEDEQTPYLTDYISIDGKPPPAEFYEKYPQFNREQIEREWVSPDKDAFKREMEEEDW